MTAYHEYLKSLLLRAMRADGFTGDIEILNARFDNPFHYAHVKATVEGLSPVFYQAVVGNGSVEMKRVDA